MIFYAWDTRFSLSESYSGYTFNILPKISINKNVNLDGVEIEFGWLLWGCHLVREIQPRRNK